MFEVKNKDTRTPCSCVSIVNFEQVNTGWDIIGYMGHLAASFRL